MRWSYRIHIYAFAAAFVVFVVLRVPASVAVELVSERVPELSASGLHGTIWHGGARRVSYREGLIEDFRWRFRPTRLLALELGYRLEGALSSGFLESTATLTTTGALRLTDLRMQSNIRELGAFAGRSYIPVDGQISLRFDHLALSDRITSASGNVDVSDAAMRDGGTQLGSYRAKISEQEGTLRADVSDSAGPLEVSGFATVDPGGRYEVSVDIVPKRSEPELESLLGLVSRRTADGNYRIRGQGTL